MAERGQDFAVYQRGATVPPATGAWQPSRDLIESFPDGAIARYGSLRAIFSHDLNAESVFDLETPAGARLRGGVRALI